MIIFSCGSDLIGGVEAAQQEHQNAAEVPGFYSGKEGEQGTAQQSMKRSDSPE